MNKCTFLHNITALLPQKSDRSSIQQSLGYWICNICLCLTKTSSLADDQTPMVGVITPLETHMGDKHLSWLSRLLSPSMKTSRLNQGRAVSQKRCFKQVRQNMPCKYWVFHIENKGDLNNKLTHRYPFLQTFKIRGGEPDLQQVLKHRLLHYTIPIPPLTLVLPSELPMVEDHHQKSFCCMSQGSFLHVLQFYEGVRCFCLGGHSSVPSFSSVKAELISAV